MAFAVSARLECEHRDRKNHLQSIGFERTDYPLRTP